jgi:hypothetical protein
MMIYNGRKPFVRLEELKPIERAVFMAWLVGMETPPDEEDAAWLEDYLRFVKQRKEERGRRKASNY